MILPGNSIPYFELLNTNNELVDTTTWDDKKVLVVIFTCNHCPYAQNYEQRIQDLQQQFGIQGVQIVLINSNDAKSYPQDSFENMKKRAKEKNYKTPYLYDKTQVVAKKFGAQVTPEAFVFDKKRVLQYKGRIDDNWQHPQKVTEHTLKEAISAVLSGGTPKKQEQSALGCSIKWA